MEKNKELPTGFKSWMQLYRELKKQSLLNEEVIVFHNFNDHMLGAGQIPVPFVFDIQFIKAKCFDEMKDVLFNLHEIDKIRYALISMMSIQKGDILDEKLKDYINNLYELGEFA